MTGISTSWAKLKSAAQSLRRNLTPAAAAWSVATRLMLALWLLLFFSFLFINVIPHFSTGKLVGLVALFIMMTVVSFGLLLLIGLASALKRSFRIGLFLALPPLLLMLALTWGVAGALVGAGVVLIALTLVVGAAATLLKAGVSTETRRKPFVFLAIGTILRDRKSVV